MGGLYGDLPPPSSTPSADEEKSSSSTMWSSGTKMAPPALRKSSSMFAPPQTILKSQQSQNKAKSSITPQIKTPSSSIPPPASSDNGKSPSFQPTLVGVTSTRPDHGFSEILPKKISQVTGSPPRPWGFTGLWHTRKAGELSNQCHCPHGSPTYLHGRSS